LIHKISRGFQKFWGWGEGIRGSFEEDFQDVIQEFIQDGIQVVRTQVIKAGSF